MKIVIAGAGEVGTHLAKLLSRENQDIVLLDSDEHKLSVIDATCNLLTHRGSPISFDSLRECMVDRCDLFIAVTPEETTNVVACTMAKSLGAAKTVARIDNYEFMKQRNNAFFKDMGIDVMIYPEYLAAKEILKALQRNWVRNWFEIHEGQLIVIGVKIREGAPLVDIQLRDLPSLSTEFHISAIKRNHETIIPRGDDYLRMGDILYVTTTASGVEALRQLCGKTEVDIRKVLIMGGSRIAVRLIDMAPDIYRFRIIERDRQRCTRLTELCPNVTVINADARDVDVLREEGITDMDAFIALTGQSETNILTSLTAKEHGVRKTIAEVEDLQYISEAENLNIGTTINKKLLASSKIFQMLLDEDAESSKFMALADADVIEIEVKEKAKVTRALVKDLSLSRDMTIAGLIRDDRGMLVGGMTQILPGDHVLVFCLSGVIHKIERLFN
ncbi:MAG: Trk system potassium transporter TrkA [Bacteroides sp.]|nr:Trk system potassium transporter TrkA [Bacteroides sp.]MCM1412888.1 Trk system potassium transporter TrkA [Bacteroides sp.]MCM1471557.1 Trk system potassium transporter TrkA [Bacteroides sp.]